MTVGSQHSDFSELRIHAYKAIHIIRSSDLDARCLSVIGNYCRLRKSSKIADKVIGTIWRNVKAVFWNITQTGKVRRRLVPIKLHINASRPSNDNIAADRVREWCYHDVGVI